MNFKLHIATTTEIIISIGLRMHFKLNNTLQQVLNAFSTSNEMIISIVVFISLLVAM